MYTALLAALRIYAPNQTARARGRVVPDCGRLPLTFERNTGRYDKRVKFVSRLGGATLFLTDKESVLVMRGVQSSKPKVERGESCARRALPLAPSPRLRREGRGEGQPTARPSMPRLNLAVHAAPCARVA